MFYGITKHLLGSVCDQKYPTAIYIALDEPDQQAVGESSLLPVAGTSEYIADNHNRGSNFMTGPSSAELIPSSTSTTRPTGMFRDFLTYLKVHSLGRIDPGQASIRDHPMIHFQIPQISHLMNPCPKLIQ